MGSQQLVIKDDAVIAVHEIYQDIRGKYPGCEIVSYEGDVTFDLNAPTPDPRTNQEKKRAYRDRRRLEYPIIADQLDMIYRDAVDGTTIWRDAITAVRVKYPKPDAGVDEQ